MSTVDETVARLFSGGWTLTCWACLHVSVVPHDPLRREYRCDQCGATSAYGEPQPRITIAPYVDRRFLKLSFEHGEDEKKVGAEIVLARGLATEFALEILSVTEPDAYRVLEKAIREKAGG